MTNQPEWKFFANLGDAGPIEHGGYMVFVDATGVYAPEAEIWDPDDKKLYRIQLDRLCQLHGDLIPRSIWDKYEAGHQLPHPIEKYVVWFNDKIESIAESIGTDPAGLRRMFCSIDPGDLAWAYRELYEHEGWENGDGYPVRMSANEMIKRWKDYL